MAKRFTDTEKWKRANFRMLTPKLKLVWFYIVDNCDHAGVWNIDLDLMSFQIGEQCTIKDVEDAFGGAVRKWGDKLEVPYFIEFQYGALDENNRVHKSIIDRIGKLKLNKNESKEGACKPLASPLLGAKDKDKDKDKERGSGGKPKLLEKIDQVYQGYPRKEGKAKGVQSLLAQIKAGASLDEFDRAVKNYAAKVRSENTEPKFIKLFSTFVGSKDVPTWKDYLPSQKADAAKSERLAAIREMLKLNEDGVKKES